MLFRSTVNASITGYTISNAGGGSITSYAISPSAPAGLSFSTSTGLLSGSPSNAASATTYSITATNAQGTSTAKTFVLTVSKANQTISFSAPASMLVNTSSTISYSASSGLTVTITNNTPSVCSLSGASLTTLTAGASDGTCSLTTSQSGNSNFNAAVSETRNITISSSLSAPTISLTPSAETVVVNSAITGYTISNSGGAASSYSISDTPTGLTFDGATGLLSGSPSTVVAATAYTVTATNASGSSSATFTLTVIRANRTIAITDPGSKTYGTDSFTVTSTTSPSSNSDGSITYFSRTTDVCTIGASNKVTIESVGSGTCTLYAQISAGSTYNSATSSDLSFTVNKKSITVTATVSSSSKTYLGTDPTVGFTSPGLVGSDTISVTYRYTDASSYNSTTIPSDSGSYTVTPEAASVSPGSTNNYTFAYSGTSYTINQAASVLSLSDTTVVYGNTLDVTTLLTNGAGSGSITYDITAGTGCSISSSTLTALVASGTCTLRATKAADTNYSSTTATATITLSKRTITVKSNNASKVAGASDPSLNGYSITSGTLYSSDTITVTGGRAVGETAGKIGRAHV